MSLEAGTSTKITHNQQNGNSGPLGLVWSTWLMSNWVDLTVDNWEDVV